MVFTLCIEAREIVDNPPNPCQAGATMVAALQEGLAHPQEYPLSEHEKFRKVLRDSGMLVELGPQWFQGQEDVPLLTHEELWELTKGMSPLSETIIEERGPRRSPKAWPPITPTTIRD